MKLRGAWEVSSLARNVNLHLEFFDGQLCCHPLKGRQMGIILLVMCVVATLEGRGSAQTSALFAVSNPKHLNWSTDEADRIYSSACELVARSIRPEKPPRLQPKFLLVLGAEADETVRTGAVAEVHLKKWSSAHFAEAMVLMATREILKNEDLMHLTRDTLIAAQASVSVGELRRGK
jgi:hypothetical protein